MGTRRLQCAVGAAVLSATLIAPTAVWATHRFSDVGDDHTHARGIDYVADTGVSSGCAGGDAFCPEDELTRSQMATFLHRASGNAPGVAPSVNADKVDGMDAVQLQGQPGPAGPTGSTGPAGPTGSTGPAGPTGPAGSAGSAGSNGVSGYEIVTQDRMFSSDFQGELGNMVVPCPAGKKAVGGGAAGLTSFGSSLVEVSSTALDLTAMYPGTDGAAWNVGYEANQGVQGIRFFAVCATA